MEKKLAKRKKKIAKRTKKRNWENQPRPMIKGANIHYDIDGRHNGIGCGGIGILNQMNQKIGLPGKINENLNLLKRHLPYHESDHILNIAYNTISGDTCLEDIEARRNDEAHLDALGAKIIPDPTRSGDFLRRFKEDDFIGLMDIKYSIHRNVRLEQPQNFKKLTIINMDGTISPTTGKCKEGMDISCDGQWGYHPLVVSLANTREPLFIFNRSGNVPSHCDRPVWIDKSLYLVADIFEKVYVQGDTDFCLTSHFDLWDKRCSFVFGMDARKNLVAIADRIDESEWEPFERKTRYKVKTQKRKRPENVKDQVVKKRNLKKLQTESEYVAEFSYQPGKCKKAYRMVVLKKKINVIRGNLFLFDDIRYFFYITNDNVRSMYEVVKFYRNRADHENDIEQLKNGVRGLHAPSDTLVSNWAYMVIASLARDLKAWYGLLMSYRPLGLSIVRMESKRFINSFMNIPFLIVKTGRRICYRIIGFNKNLKHMVNFSDRLKKFAFS